MPAPGYIDPMFVTPYNQMELSQFQQQGTLARQQEIQNALAMEQKLRDAGIQRGMFEQEASTYAQPTPDVPVPVMNVLQQPTVPTQALVQQKPVAMQQQPMPTQVAQAQRQVPVDPRTLQVGKQRFVEQQRLAKEKEYKAEVDTMQKWSQDKIKAYKDLVGEDGDMQPLFGSLSEAYKKEFERTGNPYMSQIAGTLDGMAKMKHTPKKGRVDKPTSFPNTREGIAMAVKNLGLDPDTKAQAELYLHDKTMQSLEFTQNESGKYSVKPTERAPRGGGAGTGTGGAGTPETAMAWNSPKGVFGSYVKAGNKGEQQMRNQIVMWMQAKAKNPGAPLYSGKWNDAKRNEAEARINDFLVSFDIDPTALVDASAARAALTTQVTRQAQFTQNAGVAEKGFKLLADMRKEGGISTYSVPALNQAENVLRTWTGDSYPGAAQGVLVETLMDYAKVVSGQTSVAGVTAHAQKTAEELMKLKDNPAQFKKKLEAYRQLMQSRLDEQKSVVKGLSNVAGFGGAGPKTDVEPPPKTTGKTTALSAESARSNPQYPFAVKWAKKQTRGDKAAIADIQSKWGTVAGNAILKEAWGEK